MVNNHPHGRISPTSSQLRAARAALQLSVIEVARAAGLGVNTVARAEKQGPGVLTPANASRLIETYETRGITFLPDDGAGLGAGLRFKAD